MKVLIIGYGSIGKRHARLLAAEGAELGIVTKQKLTDYPCWASLEAVPDLRSFDFFLIASETVKHYDQLEYLSSKLEGKRILVEKPLFMTHADLPINKNQVFVSYNLRFHAILQEIKTRLAKWKPIACLAQVGQWLPDWRPEQDYTKSYSADPNQGGGVLLDLSHELDYLTWLFGPMTLVESFEGRISPLRIQSEDFVSLIAQTSRQVALTLSMDYISRIPMRNLVIHCEEGTLIADLIAQNLRIKGEGDSEERRIDFSVGRDETYQKTHQAFFSNEPTDLCTYQEGIEVMRQIEMIRDSARQKEWNG